MREGDADAVVEICPKWGITEEAFCQRIDLVSAPTLAVVEVHAFGRIRCGNCTESTPWS